VFEPVYQEEDREPLSHHEVLFRYQDLPDWAQVASRWIVKYPKIAPAAELYFSSLYSPAGLEFRFLARTQALEAFHRRAHRGRYTSIKHFEQSVLPHLLQGIPSGIANDYRDALRSRL